MIPVVINGCFAAYHWAPGPAVLICPPFGFEALATARAWRDLAEQLARHDIAALRLDLPGTGDSAGSPTDANQVAGWRDAVDAAIAWLGLRHGGRVSLLGQRLGALLALDAAARGAVVERLVLLDPPPSGTAFARGLRARARLEGHGAPPEGHDFIQALDVPIAPETLADLAAMPAAPAPGIGLPPVLLALDRAWHQLSAWPAWLQSEPAAVTAVEYEGYADFAQQDSLTARPPTHVFARVLAFLPRHAVAARPPPAAMRLELPDATEEPVMLETPARLFGILCQSAGMLPEAPVVLLPSIGNLPRSGHGRAWTDLARRLAAQGMASLRFDMGHATDSGGATRDDPLVASYLPDRVDELHGVVAAMTERRFARAVVIGHCSGAYTGWLAAMTNPRIAGLLASNPQFLNQQRRLTRATIHRRPGVAEHQDHLMRADAAAGGPSAEARASTRALISLLADRLNRHVPKRLRHALRRIGHEELQMRRGLRHLVRRDCALHLVFADTDHGLTRLRRGYGETPSLPDKVQLTVIAGADHNYAARRHRAAMLDVASRFALGFAPAAMRGAAPVQDTADQEV